MVNRKYTSRKRRKTKKGGNSIQDIVNKALEYLAIHFQENGDNLIAELSLDPKTGQPVTAEWIFTNYILKNRDEINARHLNITVLDLNHGPVNYTDADLLINENSFPGGGYQDEEELKKGLQLDKEKYAKAIEAIKHYKKNVLKVCKPIKTCTGGRKKRRRRRKKTRKRRNKKGGRRKKGGQPQVGIWLTVKRWSKLRNRFKYLSKKKRKRRK